MKLIDDTGNSIETTMAPQGKLLINLFHKETNKKFYIGFIDTERRVLVIGRNRKRHLLRKASAYGVNEWLLENSTKFDKVEIDDTIEHFIVPREVISQYGFMLEFSKRGYSPQRFIKLEYLRRFNELKNI
jgi:hypothetical protein